MSDIYKEIEVDVEFPYKLSLKGRERANRSFSRILKQVTAEHGLGDKEMNHGTSFKYMPNPKQDSSRVVMTLELNESMLENKQHYEEIKEFMEDKSEDLKRTVDQRHVEDYTEVSPEKRIELAEELGEFNNKVREALNGS